MAGFISRAVDDLIVAHGNSFVLQERWYPIPGRPPPGRYRDWDELVSDTAPDIAGDIVHFVALENGDLLVEEDQPEGALYTLADRIELTVEPPYAAVAVRNEGDVWSAGALKIDTVTLPAGTAGQEIDLTVMGGVRQLTVDGEPSDAATPALDAVGTRRCADFTLQAERLDDTTWAVEVSPL